MNIITRAFIRAATESTFHLPLSYSMCCFAIHIIYISSPTHTLPHTSRVPLITSGIKEILLFNDDEEQEKDEEKRLPTIERKKTRSTNLNSKRTWPQHLEEELKSESSMTKTLTCGKR